MRTMIFVAPRALPTSVLVTLVAASAAMVVALYKPTISPALDAPALPRLIPAATAAAPEMTADPRIVVPAEENAPSSATAVPIRAPANESTAAPAPAESAPSLAPSAAPARNAPQQQSPSGVTQPDKSGYGANGPAVIEPGGSRLITDDSAPTPPKVILPKGSMGQ